MNRGLQRIHDPNYVKMLFFLCWMVYCTSYIGRLNYSSAMTLMISEGVLTAAGAGFISMLYFFAYGVGQLINGVLGDRTDPLKMILTGLVMSAAANVGMGLGTGFVFMAVVWGFNGYCQSMIWAPIIRIFAEMLSGADKVNCSVNIASSGVIGTLLSYLLSAALIAWLPWNSVFLSAAVLLLAAAAAFYVGIQKVIAFALAQPAQLADEVREDKRDCRSKPGIGPGLPLLSSGILFLILPVVIHGMLKDGVTAWVPTYISGNFAMSAAGSVLLTTVLPIISLTGAYVGRFVYRRTRDNIGLSMGVFFASALMALMLLLTYGNTSVMLTLLFLAVITSSMMAINTLAINVYPLRFEKYGRVSGISGSLNAMTYLGSAISTYAIGLLVQWRGWQTTMLTWLFGAALALVLCLIAVKKVKEV